MGGKKKKRCTSGSEGGVTRSGLGGGGSMWEKDRKSRGGRGLCIGRLGRVLAS